jgi:uncharacterized membrane protein YGL010W
MARRSSKDGISRADKLFREYGASHQNKVNKLIHWICVPTILVSVIGLLESIPFPFPSTPIPLSWGRVVSFFALFFYVNLSPSLAVGMAAVLFGSFQLLAAVERAGYVVWKTSLAAFAAAWVLQFIGHR